MSNPLLDQLDYIYFFYGLVLFLLGSVCISMSKGGALPTPWWLLGVFGFLHGAVEWLDLVALTGGDSTAFRLARELLLAASFLTLLEFARRTHRVVRGRTLGPWIHLVGSGGVLALVLASGAQHLSSAVRPLIAAPAIFWTAWLFIFASRHSEELGGGSDAFRARTLASIYFTLFGFMAGLVVPAAPFIPRGWPSGEGLLATTGIPIQLLHGVTVSVLALSVWALAVSFDPKGRVLRKKRLLFWTMSSAIAALLAGGWVFTDRLGRLHQQETAEEAESTASQVEDHLLNELHAADGGARTLATLLGQLHLHGGRVELARLDQLVDAVTLGSDGWVAYVLDPSGTTIASSNRGRPDSFLGKNFAARPYFRTARGGRVGRFFGVGLVSGTPGYYASEPVTGAAGQVVAVAVVKCQLGSHQLGPKVVVESFIVSAEGRAVIASGDGGVSRLMWNVGPPPAIDAPGADQDPPTPLFDHPIQGTEMVKVGADRLVAVRRPIPDSDWTLLVLKQERTQLANRILGIVITLLLCSVVLTYFVAMQRQLGAESQINDRRRDAEGRARDSARRADTDALTGVLNRLGFDAAYGKELERARRYGHPLSVVMLDLDHFKRVNDQHGHAAGDQVLVGAARIVETNVRDSDAIGRWGGEEFMVLAPATSAAGAVRLAEKLRALMAATIFGPAGAVTGSFGVAELRPDDTVESLLQRADAALYRAKSQGRNRVACDDADVTEALAVAAAPSDPAAAPAPAAPLLDGTAIYAETGFPPMDLEHRALSDAISAFFAMLSTGKTEEVQVALESIIVGVGIHFDHEERLMEATAYPARAGHLQQHVLFVAEARLHLEGLVAAGVTVPFRRWVVGRLPEWFRLHILEYDVDLGRFLVGSGATDEPALPRRAAGR